MKRILQYFVMVVCIPIFCSCQSNGKNQIKTAADWVAYCREIDDPVKIIEQGGEKECFRDCFRKAENGFNSIKPEDVSVILTDLVLQITNGDDDSPLMKDKCYAFTWLFAAYTAHTTYLEDKFTEEQKVEITNIVETAASTPVFSGKIGLFVGEYTYNLIIIIYSTIFSEDAAEDILGTNTRMEYNNQYEDDIIEDTNCAVEEFIDDEEYDEPVWAD